MSIGRVLNKTRWEEVVKGEVIDVALFTMASQARQRSTGLPMF